MQDYLPYIVSVVCALIAGFTSYAVSRKQAKADLTKIEKQHELDMDKQRELFEMEKEKIQLQHSYQIELVQKEAESSASTEMAKTLLSEFLKNPEIQRQISQGAQNGNRQSKRK